MEFLPKDVSHSKSVIVSNLSGPEDFCPVSALEVKTFSVTTVIDQIESFAFGRE